MFRRDWFPMRVVWFFAAVLLAPIDGQAQSKQAAPKYEQAETRELVKLVSDAAELVREKGAAAFKQFATLGRRWRDEEKYIFVLDTKGNMVVHPDNALQGKNQLDLKDINGKPIIRGLIDAATAVSDKPEGWYHYEWPVPGGLLPRWKSSYVRRVETPKGEKYIVGSGMYNDEMERAFVVDLVQAAAEQVAKKGREAFPLFHDPSGPFLFKDAYVYVIDSKGIELVNPAFPNLEGRKVLDVKDTEGKPFVRELFKVTQSKPAGWVDYMWPKPGESVSTQKSTYVMKTMLDGEPVLVAAGSYLADAPKEVAKTKKLKAPELMDLVRDAADVFAQKGEKAFPEFRKKGSRWFQDDTYFFVWTLDGKRIFHAAFPETEGEDVSNLKDVLGRPIGKMFIEAASTPAGEGWGHYMYPEPEDIFPVWKSSFVKRVRFPDGKQYIIGSGIYNMEMNRAFIEDMVNRAAALVGEQGRDAFAKLRDKTGPFVFMDTYVFVETPKGTELVNAAQPSLEGKNLIGMKDLNGKYAVRDYIDAAMKNGRAWVDYYWYRPGENTIAHKYSYVRRVDHGGETFVLGAGYYPREEKHREVTKSSWEHIEKERLSEKLTRQMFSGEKATLAKMAASPGAIAPRHSHDSEEYMTLLSGALKIEFEDRTVVLNAGEVIMIPPNVPHEIFALEDSTFFDFFTPQREDWLRGEDKYLRQARKRGDESRTGSALQ